MRADAVAPPVPETIPSRSWLARARSRAVGWLGQARVRRWLARFPLSRPVARRYAHRLFDLSAGFVYSQVLAAFVELDLAERLGAGPQTPAALAKAAGLPEAAMRRLLEAGAALDLCRAVEAGQVELTAMGAALRDNQELAVLVAHHRMLYQDLADPVTLLRRSGGTNQLAGFWPYANRADPSTLGGEDVAAYSRLMTASAPLVIHQILDTYPIAGHRHLLDVGGGEGAFIEAALRHVPGLRGTLFDLPAVAARGRDRLAAGGLGDRVTVVGGDFTCDRLPEGADLITCVRILHDHDDPAVARILAAARAALRPGGRVMIAEPFAETPGAATVGNAYFGLYLFAMGQGRCRTAEAYGEMLREAGFSRVRRWRPALPLQAGILTGEY